MKTKVKVYLAVLPMFDAVIYEAVDAMLRHCDLAEVVDSPDKADIGVSLMPGKEPEGRVWQGQMSGPFLKNMPMLNTLTSRMGLKEDNLFFYFDEFLARADKTSVALATDYARAELELALADY